MVQFVEHFQKVPHRASHSVERPDHDYIEAAVLGIGHKPIETGSACSRPAKSVICVFTHDLERALYSELPKFMQLCLGILIQRGNADINGCSLHSFSPLDSSATRAKDLGFWTSAPSAKL